MPDFLDKPVTFDAARRFFDQKANLPTGLSSREISMQIPARIRMQAFFSAKVTSANTLSTMREVAEAVARGDYGYAEGRYRIRNSLRAQGVGIPESGSARDRNLQDIASTRRLELVLRQNVAMAHAVGQREVAEHPAIMEYFPNYEYVATMDGATRDEHARFNGLILPKTDPFWNTHYPPWEFNCRCSAFDTDAEPNGRHGGGTVKFKGRTEDAGLAASGFVFQSNPRDAFTKPNFAAVKDPALRATIEDAFAAKAKALGAAPDEDAEARPAGEGPAWHVGDEAVAPDERQAIYDWSSPLFDDMVAALNGRPTKKVSTEQAGRSIENLRTALAKLPPFEGTTYRGVTFKTAADKAMALSRIRVGNTLLWMKFSASSQDQSVAHRYSIADGYGYVFIVNGRSGRDVSRFVRKPGELEVLFQENVQIRVDKIEDNRIFVTEVRRDEQVR